MPGGMNQRTRQNWAKLFVFLAISVGVSGGFLFLRKIGKLQSLEWVTYDLFVRKCRPKKTTPMPVTIVGLTERDIRKLNHYPASDDDFAKLLNQLIAAKPRAIGVDIF